MPDVLLRHIDQSMQADYDRFVFNTPAFLNQYAILDIQSFYLFNTESQKLKAEIHFILKNQIAYSPWRGSFGSYQFAEDLPEADLLDFHLQVEKILLDLSVKKIVVRNFPQAYAPKQSVLVERLLLSQNFTHLYTDHNYHLNIDSDFENNLRQSEKSRLKQLTKKRFTSAYWPNPDLEEVYKVLLQNRTAKGYTMSMDLESFRDMFTTVPETYFVFRTVEKFQTIAIAVCVRINNKILYNFYIGELPEYRKYSPVAGLIKCIYDYSVSNNYRMLDLGIATECGLINEGLARFKVNMGGERSAKGMFEKNF